MARKRTPPATRLAPINKAAADYGVTRRTVERWCDAGLLTRYRLGPRLVRIDLDELAALAVPEPARGGDAA